jgi:hypothetical protein
MNTEMNRTCIACFIGSLIFCGMLHAEPRGKIIGYGWDLLAATPDILLANAERFDATGLDGVFTEIRFSVGGKRYSSQTIATDANWPRKELERSCLSALKEFPKHKGLKESLLGAWFMPQKRLHWNDDSAWRRFAGNMGELARLARMSGLKGLFLDTEDYTHQRQFVYIPGKDGVTYDAAVELARRRGREMSAAIFSSHPDAVLMATWFLSVKQGYALASDAAGAMRSCRDLWPVFLNGMLETAPLTAKFIDGCENGYELDSSENEFYREAARIQACTEGLVSQTNKAKFREPFAVGFGVYLDAYVNPQGSLYYFAPASDGSRTTVLRRNLRQAIECASSGYVWVYGEKNTFVDWIGVPPKLDAFQKRWGDKLKGNVSTWEKRLGGVGEALRYAKDRDGELRKLLKGAKLDNMIGNGECNAKNSGSVPKGFWDWTAPGSLENVFGCDLNVGHLSAPSIVAKESANGSVGVDLPVSAGEILYCSFWMKGDGGSGSVAFKKGGSFIWKWPRSIFVFGEKDGNGWRKGEVFAEAPAGADKMTVMASASVGAGCKVWFDDFVVHKLPVGRDCLSK